MVASLDLLQIGQWNISCKLQYQEYKAMGRGGGQVVSVLAFNSDDLSSNPVEAYSFFCKKNVNEQKEAGVCPFLIQIQSKVKSVN